MKSDAKELKVPSGTAVLRASRVQNTGRFFKSSLSLLIWKIFCKPKNYWALLRLKSQLIWRKWVTEGQTLYLKSTVFSSVLRYYSQFHLKQKIRNHYAKMCPGWEETGLKYCVFRHDSVLLQKCYVERWCFKPWTSYRKLQLCPNLENSVLLPEARGYYVGWSWDYWFVSLELWDVCGIFPVTQIHHTDENCKYKRKVLWNILIFHWTGKIPEFIFVYLSLCKTEVIFSSVLCWFFFQCVYIYFL